MSGYGRGYYVSAQLARARVGRDLLKLGDRVEVKTAAHDPSHYGRGGTIAIVHPGPVYGVLIDGMESMGIHKWYVGDELALEQKPRTLVGQEPRFERGDRVTLTEYPSHDPYHYGRNATVVKIHPGPAYGVLIDGMESMGTHKWYVGDEMRFADEPEKRTIGPVILAPDLVMLALGTLGVVGSRYIKSEAASMTTLMVGAMFGATGLHGTIMRLAEGGLKFEVNYPPRTPFSTSASPSKVLP